MPINPFFGVLAFTAVINLLVASMAWQRRGALLAATYFSLMMAAATVYAAVAALEAIATTLAGKLFWSTLEYAGTGGIILFFLLFADAFTHQRSQVTYSRLGRLSLLPLFNLLVVATNGWHHWVWSSVAFAPSAHNLAIYHHGPGYYWVVVGIYLYVLRGIQLLATAALNGSPLRRRQALFLLLGSLFPYLGGALYSLQLTPAGLNITPMSFMATGIILFWALFRIGVFDVLPIARETVIEQLRDGVIVVDLQHRIVDINRQGHRLLRLKRGCMGRSLHTALANLPDLLHHYDQGHETPLGLWLNEQQSCYVTVQISALADRQGEVHGRLLVLQDVTQQYQADLELRQAHACLQRQLQEIQFLQAELTHQARRDQLTGLFNRHYLNEQIPQILQAAQQAGTTVVFIMLDIDHFKQINDTHGHRAGDIVLQAFGQMLLQHVRSHDLACRLGGEEFLVVLPHTTLTVGQQRADSMRRAFETSGLQWAGATITTTVSGGIALFPDHGTNDDDLLHAADVALYDAKRAGRNQICCFNQPLYPPREGDPLQGVVLSPALISATSPTTSPIDLSSITGKTLEF
jgi:diguanylate cyclase (GGDEF)-like protein